MKFAPICLKHWELQHVGGEGREEEVCHEVEVHLLKGLAYSHPLHQPEYQKRAHTSDDEIAKMALALSGKHNSSALHFVQLHAP